MDIYHEALHNRTGDTGTSSDTRTSTTTNKSTNHSETEEWEMKLENQSKWQSEIDNHQKENSLDIIEEDEIEVKMENIEDKDCEIEEEINPEESGSLEKRVSYPKPPKGGDEDDVYVAIGKSSSSMDALSWALKNAIKPWSFVYLVHVFPPVNYIPTPLGNMPRSTMRKEEVEVYMNQERGKIRQMLQKYQNLCRNYKVELDIHLIESDQMAEAILELISVLRIKKLVMGTSKSNLRKLKRGGTEVGKIQKNAPPDCEVKIICEGKEVNIATEQTPPTSPLARILFKSKSNGNTPVSSPSHEIETNRDKDKRNKTKVPKFFRCFSNVK